MRHHHRVPPTEPLVTARLLIAFLTMALVGGLGNAFPVLLPPLLAEFGGSRAAVASSASLLWIGSGALGLVAGRLVDRGDPRLVIVAGLVATALGMTGAALAPSLGAFSLLLGAGGGIGVGLTGFVPQASVIAATYRERRGLATGIAFAGAMMGYVLATPAHWAITAVGWRWTLAGWAVVVLALVPLVLRHYPERLVAPAAAPGAEAPASAASALAIDPHGPAVPTLVVDTRGVRDVVRTVAFWALAVSFTLSPMIAFLLTLHHMVYFTARGVTAGEAAGMLLIGGILAALGRVLAGHACDRLGAAVTGVASWIVSLAGTLCLVAFELAPARLAAYGYVVLLFLPNGSRATIVSELATRIAPPGRFGSVFGLLVIGNSLGGALGPFLSGAIYDVTGSYLAIWTFGAVAIVVATAALAVFIATAPRAPR